MTIVMQKKARYGVAVFLGILAAYASYPAEVRAHLDPEEGTKIYEVSVALTGASVIDDDNFFGPAKLLFEYFVTPTEPKHDDSAGITSDPITINSGESVTFDPIEIYSHEQCGCAQDFKFQIFLKDHSPILSTAKNVARIGTNIAGGFVTGGPAGAIVSAAGEALGAIVDYGMEMGGTDTEKAARERARLRRESESIGRVFEKVSTDCDPAKETFTSAAMDEGTQNGTLTYQVVKRETDRACVDEPVVDEFGGPDEPEDERPQCILETGKVLIDGEYYCPISAVPVGMGCGCRAGYEWAYLDNKCEGCTRVKNDYCLDAVRATIEDGTGQLEPELTLEGENMIKWTWGPMSCKAQDAVLFDTAHILPGETFKHREYCTNLEFVRGDPTGSDSCGLEFLWKYK